MDLDAAAWPLKKNPSSWSHRVKVAILAAVGAIIAAYMSLYQLDLIPSVWDPVFGPGTERVLTSEVSQAIDRIFHVPDALLGALAYGTEILFALSGSTRRWQYRPWIVALFGLNVLGLACVGAGLIAAQGLIVKSWCFLCLATALISFVLAPLVRRGGVCEPALPLAGLETLRAHPGGLEYVLGPGLGPRRRCRTEPARNRLPQARSIFTHGDSHAGVAASRGSHAGIVAGAQPADLSARARRSAP